MIGSVNSNVTQYRDAIDTLLGFDDWFLDEFVTGVFTPDEFERAFKTGDDVVKSVIEFDSL